MASSTNRNEPFAEGSALTHLLGNNPKVRILSGLLSENDVDINVTQITDLAGIHRSTVYDHIGDLVRVDVVEQTRTVGGSPLYRINRDSEVAENLAQLEWDLLDVLCNEE